MRTQILGVLTFSFMLADARLTHADDAMPTNADLRTAYCVPVMQDKIQNEKTLLDSQENFWNQIPADDPARKKAETSLQPTREAIVKDESTLNRLQLYLGPKIMQLDPVALLAASKRANADVKALKSMVNHCFESCGMSGLGKKEVTDAQFDCTKSCNDAMDKDLISRLRACVTPTWLPF